MNTKGEYRIGPGAASLMLILVVLCMTVLGALALVSARGDMRLTRRSAQMTAWYSEAEVQTETLLAQIDGILFQCAQTAGDDDAYLEAVWDALPEACDMDENIISFAVDAQADRSLECELTVLPLGSEEGRYRLTKRALMDNAPWDAIIMEENVW